MTVVCGSGFGLPPAILGVSAPMVIPQAPGPAALLDAVRPPLDAGETVIALHPVWQPDPWHHDLQVVRSILQTDALIAVPVDLPPLAGAILGGLLAQAGAAREPAATIAAVEQLTSKLTSIGWLGTVSGLSHLPVSLQLHTRSVVPGSAFVAVATGAERRVVPTSRRKPALPLPLPDQSKRITLAAGDKGDLEAVRQALTAAGWWGGTTEVATTALGTTWWGTDRHVEVVVHPATAAAASASLGPVVEGEACGRCGQRTPTDPCSFCRHKTAGAVA
ncbi:hypothetical protein [Nitriliruptor alkaliphilus]|uniref:hypothetical protein n=1 Tax=Nitriliruptor alkaliphilus TaxID=427918 RepID=UPI0006990A96|nr:hypothetical protein [Nitriliruptor alkaliphilus]